MDGLLAAFVEITERESQLRFQYEAVIAERSDAQTSSPAAAETEADKETETGAKGGSGVSVMGAVVVLCIDVIPLLHSGEGG